MSYKLLVQQIRELPWHTYKPKSIMYLSWCTAVEFAESLRCAILAYPDNENLKEMAEGELNTDNLSYDDYNRNGDHQDFLSHFLDKNVYMSNISDEVFNARKAYWEGVKALGDDTVRAMTIFSREQELPGIFEVILKSHDWKKFPWFRYYLERHIELDSQDGGHAELTKEFPLDESVLEKFYQLRLDLYKSLEEETVA
jgi:hypothetical protein